MVSFDYKNKKYTYLILWRRKWVPEKENTGHGSTWLRHWLQSMLYCRWSKLHSNNPCFPTISHKAAPLPWKNRGLLPPKNQLAKMSSKTLILTLYKTTDFLVICILCISKTTDFADYSDLYSVLDLLILLFFCLKKNYGDSDYLFYLLCSSV